MEALLFVYGSLRPGQCNFHQVAPEVIDSQPAVWPGHLLLRPEGYPALVLPPHWPVQAGQPFEWTSSLPATVPTGSAPLRVQGDILRLRIPPDFQRRLDEFEGFYPDHPEYLRVAAAWQGKWVWTYVAPPGDWPWETIEHWPPHDGPLRPWRP